MAAMKSILISILLALLVVGIIADDYDFIIIGAGSAGCQSSPAGRIFMASSKFNQDDFSTLTGLTQTGQS